MKQIKVLKNIVEKHMIKNGQRISLRKLKDISDEEKIYIKDLVFILGCYKGIMYKEDERWTTINLGKSYTTREKVELIKIDLKYLDEYGPRSYPRHEIEEICKEYEIDIKFFLMYIRKYKICYDENMEIILKNKEGIWIGENPPLSNKFLDENLEHLKKELRKVSYHVSRINSCEWMSDKLFDIGYIKLLDHGEIERNLSFDKNRVIAKLLWRAKYHMIDYMINEFKVIDYSDNIENLGYYEEMEESSIENWLYPIKFKLIQKTILYEIRKRLHSILENRNSEFRFIYKKLKISKEKFYTILKEIQELFIVFKKVKICTNGKVVILNEE